MRTNFKNILKTVASVGIFATLSLLQVSCVPLGTAIPGGISLGGGGGSSGGGGGGGGGGSPGAPTVSIPAPIVTRLTVSEPTRGVANITGFPGCAVGGNIVEARNITKLGARTVWNSWLIREAMAAITVQTTSNPDGSFSMEIDADKGDEIEIFQKDPSNVQSGPFVRVTSLYKPLLTQLIMKDVLIGGTTANGDNFVIGTENGEGKAVRFSFGSNPTLGASITMKDANGSICPTPIAGLVEMANDFQNNNRLFIIDHDSKQFCVIPKDGSDGIKVDLSPDSPVAMASTYIKFDQDRVVLTTDESSPSPKVKIINSSTPQVVDDIQLPAVAGNPNLVNASAIAAYNPSGSGTYALLIAKYDNGTVYGFILDTKIGNYGSTPGQLLSGVVDPLKLIPVSVVSGGEANFLLLDGAGKLHRIYASVNSGAVVLSFSIDVGLDPIDMQVDASNGFALISSKNQNRVDVVDTIGQGIGIVYSYVDLGEGPTKIGFNGNQFGIIQEVDNFFTILQFISYPNDIIGLIMDPNGFTPSFLPKPVRKVPVLVKPFFAAFEAGRLQYRLYGLNLR